LGYVRKKCPEHGVIEDFSVAVAEMERSAAFGKESCLTLVPKRNLGTS
jgi:uncharacterized radical SAM superfamily Fe-S cluster-containing enzyme